MTKQELIDHEPVALKQVKGIIYEKRPARTSDGKVADGLYNVWITIDNPKQFNSYSVEMLKELQVALRSASDARDIVTVVLTSAGSKAFCIGGDVVEFANYYGGNAQEFRRFMRLFDDTISAILSCEKPVICRVNGMRGGGGQELGLACDISIAQDLAVFSQSGPKHGGAMLGGVTDFLPAMIGTEEAMAAGILCETMTAHKARRIGMLTAIVPALKVDGKFVANPTAVTDRYVDEFGEIILGETKKGEAFKQGRAMISSGEVDLSLLDAKVDEICARFVTMFPEALTKTLEALRKPKLEMWNRNKDDGRAWLALNMLGEARAGFRAFNEGSKEAGREVDFVALRQAYAVGAGWSTELIDSLMPKAKK